MFVKICGIQTIEIADAAVKSGADFIGFVFADSRRRVNRIEARKISKHVGSAIQKVGVFVNENPAIISEIAHDVGLDYVQLHGDETEEMIKRIHFPVIKAYSVHELDSAIEVVPASYYLIDSPPGKYRGGTGQTFDWELLKDVKIPRSKIIVAGGLTPENVGKAIEIMQPAGVDVSSGVETNGYKDPLKIQKFIQKVKG